MLKPRGLLGQRLCGQSPRALELRIVDGQGAEQHPLDLGERRGPRFDVVAAAERGLAQLLAQHGRVDAQLLRGVGGKLVAGELLRQAANVRQQVVHGLYLLLGAGAGEEQPGALDEVIGLAARAAEGRRVGLHAPLADVAVRVEAAVEGDDLDVEALLGEQGDGFLRGIRAGGVGIEVDDDLRGVALENRHLLLGEGRAGGGDHVLNAAQKDRDAVHLALDEQSKLMLADRLARPCRG